LSVPADIKRTKTWLLSEFFSVEADLGFGKRCPGNCNVEMFNHRSWSTVGFSKPQKGGGVLVKRGRGTRSMAWTFGGRLI
jgi:hypothetical protein